MRTLGEVIKDAERWHGLAPGSLERDALYYLRMYKELADDSEAFAAWRENPPLTWEELRQMEGKPVWVELGLLKPRWYLIEGFYGNQMIGVDALGNRVPFYIDGTYTGGYKAYRKERG